jgi:hypothetical protein
VPVDSTILATGVSVSTNTTRGPTGAPPGGSTGGSAVGSVSINTTRGPTGAHPGGSTGGSAVGSVSTNTIRDLSGGIFDNIFQTPPPTGSGQQWKAYVTLDAPAIYKNGVNAGKLSSRQQFDYTVDIINKTLKDQNINTTIMT